MEEPGRSGLGRGLVEWKQSAAGVLERTQQTRLSLECKMEKVGETEHGRMALAGQGAVSELEVTCADPAGVYRSLTTDEPCTALYSIVHKMGVITVSVSQGLRADSVHVKAHRTSWYKAVSQQRLISL